MNRLWSGRKTMRGIVAGLLCAALFVPSSAGAIGSVTFKLSGYVLDAIGRPLGNASVASSYISCDAMSECISVSTSTSPTGYYQMTQTSTGTIGLTAFRSDVVSQTTTRTIAVARDTQVDFTSLYRLNATLSKVHHAPKAAASSATATVTSFAPEPGAGVVPSCVVVTDSRTMATTAAVLSATNPDGSSSWTWALNIPQGAPNGSYSLTVGARECSGEQRDLSQIRVITYVVDTVEPEILNLTPLDGQNTIFSSQPLQAEIRDSLAGIAASAISFTITDRTSGVVSTLAATYNASAGIATSASPASLIVGHDYTVQVRATDRAGNASEDGHRAWKGAGNADNGGFRLIAPAATQATSSISVSCPVTGDPLGRVATCEGVAMSVSDLTATVTESRHSYDTAYIQNTFGLTTAEIKAGVQSTNAYARRIATGSEWDPRLVAYSYRVGDRLELPATFTAKPPATALALGTLKVSVPSEWTGVNTVTLFMQAAGVNTSGGVLSTSACAAPLGSALPCSTDPLWSRFDVRLDPSLTDRAGLMSRHRDWGATVLYEWDDADVIPSYEAIIPPAARSMIAGDAGVLAVNAVRSPNLEDRYAPLLGQIPATVPATTGTHLRWDHAESGVRQEIALAPSEPSRVSVTPPFIGSADEPAPPEAATGPVDVVQVTPIASALAGDTPVRAETRKRARYETAGVPYWVEAMPVADDGMRFVVQMRDATAPTVYDFALSLPQGTTLIQGENGAATVVRDPVNGVDPPVGYFSPPFAYDADGRSVAVTQTVTPASIRLTLTLTGTETYPVVADPTYTAITCNSAGTGGTAADFLRDNRRCPYGVTFVWAKGYWPKKARVAGDSTGYRYLREDGECSAVPDTALYFDFQVSCRMHDYGYDLIRVKAPWNYLGVNKDDVDRQFLDAMAEHCSDRSLLFKFDCYRAAVVYYSGVVAFGRPDRGTAPSGSWPSTRFLRNQDFRSGLTNWTKTGSGTLIAERDANTGWYHAEMNCTTAGCGLYQNATVPNNLRGGESLSGAGQVHCDQTSGDCTYTVRMEIRRVSDGAWVFVDDCSGSAPTHNPVGWYDVCGLYGTVPLNTQYDQVQYKFTSAQTGRRLDLRFPVLEMS